MTAYTHAVFFGDAVEVTPELAEAIGCGLPEILAAHRDWHPEPMVCTAIDPEARTLVFEGARRKPGASLLGA